MHCSTVQKVDALNPKQSQTAAPSCVLHKREAGWIQTPIPTPTPTPVGMTPVGRASLTFKQSQNSPSSPPCFLPSVYPTCTLSWGPCAGGG